MGSHLGTGQSFGLALSEQGGFSSCLGIVRGKSKAHRKSKDGTLSDLRLSGDHRDGRGRRHLTFHAADDLCKESKFDDWPIQGPRASIEVVQAVRDGGLEPSDYHLQWLKNSGTSQYGAAAHELRVLLESMRLAMTYDQVDISNLACFENLARRLIRLEVAVSKGEGGDGFGGSGRQHRNWGRDRGGQGDGYAAAGEAGGQFVPAAHCA